MTFNSKQCARRKALYDVDPRTGASIEVLYADRALESFGRRGAGWFWWARRRGLLANRRRDRPVPYELLSISKRDAFAGADLSMTNVPRSRWQVNMPFTAEHHER